MIKITSLTLVLTFSLLSCAASQSPLYAYQTILWGGATTAKAPNTSQVYYFPFSSGVLFPNTYNRSVFLSGLKAPLTNQIDFTITIDPFNADNYAYINVAIASMSMYTISTHVLMVNATCDWLWVFDAQYHYTSLSDKDHGAPGQGFGLIGGPQIISTGTDFQAYHFIQYFSMKTFVTSNNKLGIQVQLTSLAAPNLFNFYTPRPVISLYRNVRIVVVFFKAAELAVNIISKFNSAYLVNEYNLLSPGVNMGIPAVYSPYLGFQGYCAIGLQKIFFGGTGANFTRSALFNQDTDPFNNIQNIIDTGLQTFEAKWQILCIMACPNGTTSSGGTCISNTTNATSAMDGSTIENCTTQLNSTYCSICDSGSYVNSSGGCTLCLTATNGTCSTCDNDTTCLSCDNDAYILVNSSCQLCNISLAYCLRCTATTCLQCGPQGYLTVANYCGSCNAAITFCLQCNNNPDCTKCMIGYFIDNNSSGVLYCRPCSDILPGCVQCGHVSLVLTCFACQVSKMLINGGCFSCPDVISNCTTCDNSTYCTSCNDTYSYLHPIGAYTQLCFMCEISLPYCLTCSSQTTCTSCVSNQYFLKNNGSCASCAGEILQCLECYRVWLGPFIRIRCSLCSSDLYFINSTTFQCDLCSSAMGNCSTCDNQTVCTSCLNSSYGFFSNITTCLLCSEQYQYCEECNQNRCTLCMAGLESLDGGMTCQCVLGELVSGVCSQIEGCVDLFVNNQGQQTCLACNTTQFFAQPVDNVCVCREGALINGVCCTIEGCIVPFVNSAGTEICLFCNISKGYLPTPVNNSCVCPDHYQNINGSCIQICGDGLYFGKYECDDGNTEDDDGCSSTCTVQTGYRCYNGSNTQPSACVYEGIPLDLELKSVKRNQELNQGLFKFTISPALININKMDLGKEVTLICQDVSYEVGSISYSSGELILTVDYTTNMEGRSCNLTLSFDNRVIRSPTSSLQFTADSQTLKLVITTMQQEYQTAKLIFTIIGILTIAIFLLSLAHKMIGAETTTCCQLVYLSNALYSSQHLFLNEVKQMRLVTGSWYMFYQSNDSQFMTPFSQRVQMTPYFMEDSVIVSSVLVLVVVVWTMLKVYQHCKAAQVAEGYQSTIVEIEHKNRIGAVMEKVYQVGIFPVVGGFVLMLLVSVFIDTYAIKTNQSLVFTKVVNSGLMLLTLFIVSVVFAVEFIDMKIVDKQKKGERSRQLRGLKEAKGWYVRLFFGRAVLLVAIIEVGITMGYNVLIYPLFLIQLVYLIVLVIGRPYHKKLDNVGLLFLETTILFTLFLPLFFSFITVQQTIQMLLTLVLQGILITSLAFSLLRLIIHYKSILTNLFFTNHQHSQSQMKLSQKSTKKSKRKKVQQKIMAEERSLELQMMANPYSLYTKKNYHGFERFWPKMSGEVREERRVVDLSHSRAVMQVEQDDEELKNVKRRLKEDLIRKKGLE